MFIDLHMHEMRYSKDSFLALEEIVEIAKEKKLNGICITDHDSMGIKEYAREYSQITQFPIFVGIEFYSLQGDIIAFGLQEYPDHRVSAQEFIDCVKAQGGVCFAAHPFRNNRRGLEEHLSKVKGLDGIEVLNGSTDKMACQRAAFYARELNLVPVGSSDCHVPEKVGVYATYFPGEIKTEADIAEAFKTGGVRPAYYKEGAYHVLDVEKFIT